MPALLAQIESALVTRLEQIRTSNGYLTDAGQTVSSGFVTDQTGGYLENQIAGDSLVIEPQEHERMKRTIGTDCAMTVTIYALTKSPTTARLFELEEDIQNAVLSADFHAAVKGVELQPSKYGPGENREFFAVGVPIRINYTKSP